MASRNAKDSRPRPGGHGGGHSGGMKAGAGGPRSRRSPAAAAVSSAAGHRGKARVSTGRREAVEIKRLLQRISDEAPSPGEQGTPVKLFAELPLSAYTLSGLKRAGFTHLTAIQRASAYHALAGRDILGAAKTGSGKTLAFMVPTVEALFRASWDRSDGVGALIVAPTRELAQQIFEVVRVVCDRHYSLTAGYVTGGKSVRDEARYISQLSVLVATPGRLLQHLEQTPGFHLDNLKVLVLDEADRLLDMGFQEQLNAILSYLPPDRQTMLFSATQTKKVTDLARLSMSSPEFVSAHNTAPAATPVKLTQHYTVCSLPDKMNLLYSFVKSHLKSKTIVFLSSCKQARFVFEVMRRVRPGVSVMALHGKQKPKKRSLVYMTFLEKKAAVLFATDIAARGLDFPGVDWVLQLDCPEDAQAYIHRVGRTARYRHKGHALMCLLPSEVKGMLPVLEAARIPLKQIKINPHRAVSVAGKVAAEVAADPDLRHLAQRAFVSYLRSVFLQPNKEVFDVSVLPFKDFALSLGLPSVPRTKFLAGAKTRDEARATKNRSKKLQKLRATIARAKAEKARAAGGAASSEGGEPLVASGSAAGAGGRDVPAGSGSDSDDDLLQPRASKESQDASDSDVDDDELIAGLPVGLHPGARERVVRLAQASRELGQARQAAATGGAGVLQRYAEEARGKTDDETDVATAAADRVRLVAKRLKERDAADRARERRRVQAKHLAERVDGREAHEPDGAAVQLGATLAGASDDDSSSEDPSTERRGSAAEDGSDTGSDSDASDSDESEGGLAAVTAATAASSGATRSRKRKADSSLASLDATEAMALALLRQRRRLA